MKKAAMAARVGNRILSIMAGILILLMLSYGMYSLWDTYKIYANSFADEELLKFRPTDDGADNPTLKDLKKIESGCESLDSGAEDQHRLSGGAGAG